MPQRRRRRWSPEIKAATVARVAAGERPADLARELGTSPPVIKQWLEAAKLKARPRSDRALQREMDAETRRLTLAMIAHYDRCWRRRARA
jgi:transposase-like protein